MLFPHSRLETRALKPGESPRCTNPKASVAIQCHRSIESKGRRQTIRRAISPDGTIGTPRDHGVRAQHPDRSIAVHLRSQREILSQNGGTDNGYELAIIQSRNRAEPDRVDIFVPVFGDGSDGGDRDILFAEETNELRPIESADTSG
jgi:hypothetical protein